MRVVWWSHKPGEDAPSEDRFNPVTNRFERASLYNKPNGGLWTSPETSTYGWEHWCRENEVGWLGDRYVLTAPEPLRVLTIDSGAALDQAWERWGRESRQGRWSHRDLDYPAVAAAGYDCLHLTEEGFWDSRRLTDVVGSVNTYSWDCETVLWFRWRFTKVERSAVDG